MPLARLDKARLLTGIVALGILAAALVSTGPRAAGTLQPDTIVADFGTGATQPAAINAALRAQRTAPDDPDAAQTAASLLIDAGRANGDSRLVGAALAILQPFVRQSLPEAQLLAATARQYQHDFAGALGLLDQILTARPRDVSALLNRATLHTVQGNAPLALQDCAAIATLRRDVGFLCQATALTMTSHAPAIATRLEAILAQDGLLEIALRPWATSILAEIAMLQGDADKAIALLETLVKADPGAQREQLMLADLWRAAAQPGRVLTLLETAPDTDGVLIRRVLALRALGQDASDLEAVLATRVQRNLDIGLTAHAREEALYFLLVAENPAAALERALVNWAQQHEYDDLQILLTAAALAKRPEAAQPALNWMHATGIAIPALQMPASVRPLVQP